MSSAPGESSDAPDNPPPVLDYRGPGEEWPEEPRIPNPAATRSLRCGLGLVGLVVGLVVLPRVAFLLPESVGVGIALMLCIVVAWFVLMVMAIGFGITGILRARQPDVAGKGHAVIGLLLGLAGVGMTILVAVGLSLMAQTYGPAGSVNRAKCAGSLRMIGQACALYANDNNGRFPPSFGAIMEDVSPGFFICPASDDTPASGPTAQAELADFAKPGHCSYIYLGAGLTTAAHPNTSIACDRLDNHDGKGIQVLYANGIITWLDKKQAKAFLASLPPTAQYPATPP